MKINWYSQPWSKNQMCFVCQGCFKRIEMKLTSKKNIVAVAGQLGTAAEALTAITSNSFDELTIEERQKCQAVFAALDEHLASINTRLFDEISYLEYQEKTNHRFTKN